MAAIVVIGLTLMNLWKNYLKILLSETNQPFGGWIVLCIVLYNVFDIDQKLKISTTCMCFIAKNW
jgi:hypothetical protein